MKVKWGPIGKVVYERTYSRVKPDGEKETWKETVNRVVDGNLAFVPAKFNEPKEREKLFELIYTFKVIPAGRHLWVTGVNGKEYINNCHNGFWTDDPIDHFYFVFDELMKGGGVGTNYSDIYFKNYAKPNTKINIHLVCNKEHQDYDEMKSKLSKHFSPEWSGCYRIEDSRKGWVESFCYFYKEFFSNKKEIDVVFDVSLIRAKGAILKGFGGKASGPTILLDLFINTSKLLNSKIGEQLKGIDYMLIDHYIAMCVVAGGIRRSARMSLKYWGDEDIIDFIHCKNNTTDHWTTNISVVIDNAFFRALRKKDRKAKNVYKEIVKSFLTHGEPGFINASKSQEGEFGRKFIGCNPCAEIHFTIDNSNKDDTGFDLCNLGHVNLSAFWDSPEDAKDAFRLMTRFLIRATFGNIENPLQKEVVKLNRRIGVGFFGFQSWLNKMGIKFSECYNKVEVRDLLKGFYKEVKEEARSYAHKLRIPEPIKLTTVAPTGTISQLPGETTGLQPIFSSYYIRRVRFHDTDDLLKQYKKEGLKIEDDIYSKNTKVVEFICKDKLVEEVEAIYGKEKAEDIIEGQSDIDTSDFFAVQEMVQQCYADNAISFTINIEATEENYVIKHNNTPNVEYIPKELYIEDIMKMLIHYIPKLKGSTVMINGSRPQSPYEKITEEEYKKSKVKRVQVSEYLCKNNICSTK